MAKDWKDRLGMMYSTNPDFEYEYDAEDEQETLPPEEQNLKVEIDRKKRKGKTVCLVSGFIGKEDDLKELAKLLKTKCGVGGSVKEGQIIIQGDFKEKISKLLVSLNYNIKN